MAGVVTPSFSNQRPGYPIRPPAIARHLVFRLRMEENPRWTTEKNPRQERWKSLCKSLSTHLTNLCGVYNDTRRIEICAPKTQTSPTDDRYSTGASCLIPIIANSAHGYRLRVRVDVLTELLSLTYIFDRIGPGGPFAAHIARLGDDVPGDSAASAWLFNWAEIGAAEVPAAQALKDWLLSPVGENPALCRGDTLITDFRGIIIYPKEDWPMDGPGLGREATRCPRRPRLAPELTEFAEQHELLIRAVADPFSIDRKAQTATDPAEHACAQGGEPVVCGMLDGEALYAAALGEWGEHVESPQPIRHLLVYAGHSHSQLGRLVRRMQVLGELRHAAIMDYEADEAGSERTKEPRGLREASRRIRVLGGRLTSATPYITRARAAEEAATPEESGTENAAERAVPSETRTPMEMLESFIDGLAEISGMVDGGLTHRIEQSRYYAQEFRHAVKHLRLVRIGDWQPYDDFVQRYILHLFARIDRIGNRYEALGRRVDRLLFFQQAKLLDSYTKSVDTTVKGIEGATGKLNISAEAQIKASNHQIRLLESADLFAVVFLVYYLGSVLDHLHEIEDWRDLGAYDAWLIFWSVLIAVLTARLIVHHRRHKRADEQSSERAAD